MEIIFVGFNVVFFIVFALVAFSICRKAARVSQTLGIDNKFALTFCAIIGSWYALSLVLSINGFFHTSSEFSQGDLLGLLLLLAVMLIPLILFFLLYRTTDSLKRIIDMMDIRALIGIQVYRICGIYFIFLASAKKAPLLFALPPGIFDLLVGVFALIIPWLLTKQIRLSLPVAKAWNYVGLFDFASAFTIYFLYFPFRILQAPASQILIGGFFPIAFIIIFPVPLAIILHVLTLMKLRKTGLSIKNDSLKTRVSPAQ